MSADNRKNGRKTLLPEFLPVPGTGQPQSLPERVAERARLLLQRFRRVGTTASAAVLSLQCSGYAVVDPLPPTPLHCSNEPTPFGSIQARALYGVGDAAMPPIILMLSTAPFPPSNFVGYSIDAVRITGGTLVGIQDMTQPGQGGSTRFDVTITPASSTSLINVEVDFACGGEATTKHYRISYHPPGPNDVLIVEEINPGDAGTD